MFNTIQDLSENKIITEAVVLGIEATHHAIAIIETTTYSERYLSLLSNNIYKSSEKSESVVKKYLQEGDQITLVNLNNAIEKSIQKWLRNLAAPIQMLMNYYYVSLKESNSLTEEISEVTKEEAELLKIAENFNVESLNLLSNLSEEEEEELLSLSAIQKNSNLYSECPVLREFDDVDTEKKTSNFSPKSSFASDTGGRDQKPDMLSAFGLQKTKPHEKPKCPDVQPVYKKEEGCSMM